LLHAYIFVLRAHPVRGERNTTGEVATALLLNEMHAPNASNDYARKRSGARNSRNIFLFLQ